MIKMIKRNIGRFFYHKLLRFCKFLFRISILQCRKVGNDCLIDIYWTMKRILLNRYIQACQGSFSSKLDYPQKTKNDQKDPLLLLILALGY